MRRTLLTQGADLVVRQAQFGQQRIGVLTETGHRTHRLLIVLDDRRRQDGLDRAGCGLHGPPAVPIGQLRVSQHLAGQIVASIADARGVGGLLDMREIMPGTPALDGLVELLAVAAAIGVGGVPRVVGQVGPLDDLAREPLPLAIVGGAEHHRLLVGGREGAVRRDRRGSSFPAAAGRFRNAERRSADSPSGPSWCRTG